MTFVSSTGDSEVAQFESSGCGTRARGDAGCDSIFTGGVAKEDAELELREDVEVSALETLIFSPVSRSVMGILYLF